MASNVPLNDTPEKGLLNPGDGPPSNPTAPVAAGASPGYVERSLFKVSRKSFIIIYLLAIFIVSGLGFAERMPDGSSLGPIKESRFP